MKMIYLIKDYKNHRLLIRHKINIKHKLLDKNNIQYCYKRINSNKFNSSTVSVTFVLILTTSFRLAKVSFKE